MQSQFLQTFNESLEPTARRQQRNITLILEYISCHYCAIFFVGQFYVSVSIDLRKVVNLLMLVFHSESTNYETNFQN